MKCKDIQDMILTDYLDDQLSSEKKEIIESHLKECAACREFFIAAKETVITPFEKSESQIPPESIWQGIKEAIDQEKEYEAPNPLRDFMEKVKDMLAIPKTVGAMTTVAVVLFMAVALPKVISYHQQQIASASQEEMDYLSYVSGASETIDENGDYETDIEAYFL